jgi:hypothetical protein
VKAERKSLAEGKKILTDEEEEKIVNTADKDHDFTAHNLANNSITNHQRVSHDTMNRLLISNSYLTRIKRK